MSTVLDELETRSATRRAALEAEWWEVVAAVGRNEPTDPDAVEQLLTGLGRQPRDLAAAVDLYRRRVGLVGRAAAEARANDEYLSLGRQVEANEAEFLKVREGYAAKSAALLARQQQAGQTVIEAQRARDELIRSCPYADVRDRVETARSAVERGRQATAQLRAEVRDLERAAAANDERGLPDAAGRQRQRAAVKLAEAQAAESEAAALDAEARAAEADLLLP